MSGPLTSLRVVEFSGIGPGPLVGQLLADLGADVVTVDRRSAKADPADVNRRNKRSVALNLRKAEGLAAVRCLLAGADVLIEGFRPGVMERLGLGPDVCLSANPRLVYGRMTGWGQTGPLAHTAGHDINYLGITGALHAIGRPDEPPVPQQPQLALAPGTTVEEAERRLIMMTLAHTRDNKTRAAEILGISLKTLHNKLNKLRLRPKKTE